MKIFVVGKDWFPNIAGGLNRYVYGEVQALPSVGICGTAVVSALRPGQTAPLTLRAMGAEGAALRMRRQGARREVRAGLEQSIELINAHFALYADPWIRGLPRSLPLVVHFHGPYADEVAAESRGLPGRLKALLARQIERRVYRRADRVITLSEAFRNIAHERYDIPLEKLRVIPGGVDTTPYLTAPERREARERLHWPQDRPILLSVRRLARRMGLEGLIEATEEIRKTLPNVLLLIGGKGVLTAELEQQIQARGLTENVRLLGFVSDADLPLTYAAADLTVVPTVTLEGFGLVTAESLASGTPVLGTPVGGTPEILRGLLPELVFDTAAPGDIANRIVAALSGKMRLPDRNACRAYAARYAWEEVAPQLRRVFEEALHA